MPARLDLPDEKIARLVDEEGLSYSEVKKKLGLDCHVDTIGRHYRQFKEQQTQEELDEDVIEDVAEKIEEHEKEVFDEKPEELSPQLLTCPNCDALFFKEDGYLRNSNKIFCSLACYEEYYFPNPDIEPGMLQKLKNFFCKLFNIR